MLDFVEVVTDYNPVSSKSICFKWEYQGQKLRFLCSLFKIVPEISFGSGNFLNPK